MVSRKKIRIGVVANRSKPGAAGLLRSFRALSAAHPQITLFLEKDTAALLREKGEPLSGLVRKVDVLVVAGGDGSLLQVAGHVYPSQVPIVGVNLGSLGFLTSVPREELAEAVEWLAKGKWRRSPRLALETVIHRGKRTQVIPCALNDVVVSCGDVSRLIRLRVQVGGQFVNEYVGDGLIVATPTGSTAYSLSAGGPLLSPDSRAVALTPICPHTLTNRSLVVSADSGIVIEVPRQPYTVVPQFDGRDAGRLKSGDWLEIRPAKAPVILAHLPESDFYGILRQKLKWSGANI
jgi:NAD+ kinase